MQQGGGQVCWVKGIELDPGKSSKISQGKLLSKPLLSLPKDNVFQSLKGDTLLLCCMRRAQVPTGDGGLPAWAVLHLGLLPAPALFVSNNCFGI
jgi:hypothetical protein